MKSIIKKIKNYLAATALLSLIFTFSSCETEPLEVLDYKQFYTGTEDVDAAILGLYGRFSELQAQVVVLNELRADLLDITPNADYYLEEINNNRPSKENPWANVSKFYGIIQFSNDIMTNLKSMLSDKKITQDEYNERYSDVASIRVWVYLQIGIQFGKATYFTTPVYSENDVNNGIELSIDDLIPTLIAEMESLSTLEDYKVSNLIKDKIDDVYSLASMFINKHCLLGDLYLFNDQYESAALQYRLVLATGEANGDVSKYRLVGPGGSDVVNKGESLPTWYGVGYYRYYGDDVNSMFNTWRRMFASTTTNGLNEMIWFVSYDKRYNSDFTAFRKLFDPVIKNGSYKLKPSDYAVESVWGNQVQLNSAPFDARGLTGGFDKVGNDNVIRKYSMFDEIPNGNYAGGWWLYRAGGLHLRFAEAANRAGYPKLAWAMVNSGLKGNTFVYTKADGTTYPGDSIKIPGENPFNLYPYPFTFDARQSDQPYIRAPWRSSVGIRGRVSLKSLTFPETCVTKDDSIHFMENVIIQEAALELGFEGHRWEDLVRVARRLNKEEAGKGDRFLWDENIKKKFDKSGNTAADLSSSDKWYIKVN
ncbi:MAG: RagB/SusD family nutrient uptake outer membrane protein [Paludibacter sp.]|nr:RagB/SusD family nutrient uptake outer membrane protein [Paludibacter sp.]